MQAPLQGKGQQGGRRGERHRPGVVAGQPQAGVCEDGVGVSKHMDKPARQANPFWFALHIPVKRSQAHALLWLLMQDKTPLI